MKLETSSTLTNQRFQLLIILSCRCTWIKLMGLTVLYEIDKNYYFILQGMQIQLQVELYLRTNALCYLVQRCYQHQISVDPPLCKHDYMPVSVNEYLPTWSEELINLKNMRMKNMIVEKLKPNFRHLISIKKGDEDVILKICEETKWTPTIFKNSKMMFWFLLSNAKLTNLGRDNFFARNQFGPTVV